MRFSVFVKRPGLTLMINPALLVAVFFAYTRLNVDAMPQIDIAVVSIFGWSNRSLVEGLGPDLESRHPGLRGAWLSFLDKIYGELEDPGIQGRHRALNFAATNLFQASESLVEALHQDFELHSVEAQKSPFCRLNSECWDVVLKFYDPEHSGRAYRVSRLTIDVSDMTPVTLGSIRAWASRR